MKILDDGKISDEEILKDIFNTEKEAKAYRNLWMAFQALSELPENDASKFTLDIRKYQYSEKQCLEFLSALMEVKNKRDI